MRIHLKLLPVVASAVLAAALVGGVQVKTARAAAITKSVNSTAELAAAMACPALRCYSCAFWTATEVKETLGGFGNQWYEYSCASVPCPNECNGGGSNNDQGASDVIDRASKDDIQRLWAAVAGGDLSRVKSFMRQHKYAKYNSSRQAIQIEGCNGSIVSNIPLTNRQAEAITE
jgi:hypothetical protein